MLSSTSDLLQALIAAIFIRIRYSRANWLSWYPPSMYGAKCQSFPLYFLCAFLCIWNKLDDTVAESRQQGAMEYQGVYAMLCCMYQNHHQILHLDAVVRPVNSEENLGCHADNYNIV